MKHIALATAAAAAVLLAASTASATVYQITLTGDTESINDFNNVFGLGAETVGSSANITNQAFVETFDVNTAGGNVLTSSTGISSNSIFGTSPPYAVSGSLEINGTTISVSGSNYSSVFTSGADYQINTNAVSPSNANENNDFSLDLHSNDLTASPIPTTVTQAFSAALTSANYEVFDSFIDSNSGGEYADASGELHPTEISIAEVSAAPEPSSWLLMIAGLGAVGLVLRRRARNTADLRVRRALAV
jgi:hypothetical protein